MNQLDEMRKSVSSLNRIFFNLLAERFKVTERIGEYKAENNMPAKDTKIEQEQLNKIVELASDNKLDPEFCKQLMQLIFKKVIQRHEEIKIEKVRESSHL